jgi:Co/Zn/Cd efflux system component
LLLNFVVGLFQGLRQAKLLQVWVEQGHAVWAGIPGVHCKNLFLKDAKARLWLVVAPADRRIDLKALPALIGAGLDNLADASVYALSLYAVGRAVQVKIRAARLSGYMIGLGVMLFVEVVRRFFGGEEPVGPAMMAMAAANAILNLVCLRLLKRHRGEDVNFTASAIFTNNDSIVNGAIVLSGVLVMWLGSNIPDLVLGVIVAGIAANGGREILERAGNAAAEVRPS